MTDLPDAVPAATLIIMRDRADGAPELLMIERAKVMAFAPGALVFPGGRVDSGDHVLAATIGEDEELPARIAAIRETIEEAGLPIGLSPMPSPGQLDAIRAALHGGESLGDTLASHRIALNLGTLIPFARWRPTHRDRRIFDTRFYLTTLPPDSPEPLADEGETVRLLWATAAAILTDADAGRAVVIFPTRRTLERLAGYADFEAAAADAAAQSVRTITPFAEMRDGIEYLCIPEGLGYPVTAEPLSSAMRG